MVEGALGWIGDIMRAIGSLIPRWEHIDQTEVAVLLRRGDEPQILEPGCHWYWPAWSRVEWTSCQLHTPIVEINTQTLDRQTVRLRAVVSYELWRSPTAVRKALVSTAAIHEAVPAWAAATLRDYARSHNLYELSEEEITDAITERIRSLGAKLLDVGLCDDAPGVVLIHELRRQIPVGE